MYSRPNRLHQLTWHDGIELLDAVIAGEVFGRHSHNSFAIGVMEQGVGGNLIRGSRHIIPQNAISLMNPDELHTGFSVTGSLKYKMLYVSEASMHNILDAQIGHYFNSIVEEDLAGCLRKRLAAISCALEQPKDAGWRLAVDGLLTDTLNLLMERYARVAPPSPGQEVQPIQRSKEFLDARALTLRNPANESPDASICLKDLAAMVGLQPNYFLSVFKKHVGISPYTYWMTRRMECAKHLLATGCSSLDVVGQLGFHDQAHLIKTFKRFFGITPKQLTGH